MNSLTKIRRSRSVRTKIDKRKEGSNMIKDNRNKKRWEGTREQKSEPEYEEHEVAGIRETT